MITGLEPLSCEDRLRHRGLLSLVEKRFWRDLIEAFRYLKGAYEKERE